MKLPKSANDLTNQSKLDNNPFTSAFQWSNRTKLEIIKDQNSKKEKFYRKNHVIRQKSNFYSSCLELFVVSEDYKIILMLSAMADITNYEILHGDIEVEYFLNGEIQKQAAAGRRKSLKV